MTFDIGIDFRQTSGYVTDPPNCTYCLAENYPVTRAGATFGWVSPIGSNARNRNSALDPRLAGVCYQWGGDAVKKLFRIDLPAPGQVDIYCAMGDAGGANYVYLEVFDNTTSLGVLVTSKLGTPIGTFWDATDTPRSSANWPSQNAPATLAFATTTMIVAITAGDSTASNYAIAHLRVIQAGSGIALEGDAVADVTGSATLTNSIPIIGASAVVTTGQGTLGVALPLAAAGEASAVGSATLNTYQALESSADASALGEGTLGIAKALQGSGLATATGTGSLSLSIPISSAALVNAIGSATLNGSIALASSAEADVSGQGTVSLSLALSSSAIANAIGSGSLGVDGALEGHGTASVAGQGTLTQAVSISGASLVATDASGTLTQIIPISGTSVVLSSGQGALHITVSMNAESLAQAVGVGDLTLRLSLSGNGLANAIGSATLGGMYRPINPEFRITGNRLVRDVRGSAVIRALP